MDVLFRSPLGALMARPWVDRAGLIALRRWYFPLSRLWAAANAAGDDSARFRAEIGGPLPGLWAQPYLPALLSRNARLASAAGSARAVWEAALFGDTAQPADRLLLLDRERRVAATHHLANVPSSIRCSFRVVRRRRAGRSIGRIKCNAISGRPSRDPTDSTMYRSMRQRSLSRSPS